MDLSGYKTYLTAALLALTAAGHTAGYIDDSTFTTIGVLLGAGGLAALRSALPPKS